MREKYKLAILTNIMAPYRLPLYRFLAGHFILRVFISGREDNRDYWKQELKQESDYVIKQVWGFQLKIPWKKYGGIFDQRYLHINPGYLPALINFRPDAVISHEMGFRSFAALIYGFIFSKPVWIGWEGTIHTEKNIGTVKKLIRRLFVKCSKRWISYGETSAEYLLSLGVRAENILKIQNCVDEQWFARPAAAPLLDINPKPVFLYAGRIIGLKGLKQYFDTALLLQESGYSFSSLIVGEGPGLDELKQYAAGIKLGSVCFHPPVRPSAMVGIYKSAGVLVFPTLQDVWGLVVNEALWSGLPVLCSKYAGCANELLPPENIFDPLDCDNFFSSLEKILRGGISPPDVSKLKTCAQVSRMILDDLRGVLEGS